MIFLVLYICVIPFAFWFLWGRSKVVHGDVIGPIERAFLVGFCSLLWIVLIPTLALMGSLD